MTINPLDNPVWHALAGPHRMHAVVRGRAAHYLRDRAPFSAVEEASAQAYADLGVDLPPGTEARLFRPGEEPLPGGWEELDSFPMLQMVATEPPDPVEDGIEMLAEADVPAMLDLVAAAKPGPFEMNTIALGCYLGVKREGRLVAMAGERLRLSGHVELSAIAVHPDVRRQGLAARLTRALMARAFARGEIPFLHVRPQNDAVALYEHLGFATRRSLRVVWLRPR